jgi:hypothetical protein
LITGEWWKRSYIGPHTPPREHDPLFWEHFMPEPELWHFDAIFWRRRCPKVLQLMKRAAAGREDPLQLVLADAEGITASDVDRFWNELVPLIGQRRGDFDSLPDVVAEMRARWDARQRRALFRLVGRFSLMLVARCEPLYLGRGRKPLIAAKTYFHLWMLAEHVIGNGREAYLKTLTDPQSAAAALLDLTPQSGLYYLALFRFESMVFEAQKVRLLAAVSPPYEEITGQGPRPESNGSFERFAALLSGFVSVMPAVRDNFKGPRFDHGYPDLYPSFKQLDSGEILVRAYRKPPKDTPLEVRADLLPSE